MAATSWFSFNTSVKYFLRTKRSPASAAAVVITETIRNEIADGKLSRNCIRVVILACNLGSNLSWQRTHDFFRVARVGRAPLILKAIVATLHRNGQVRFNAGYRMQDMIQDLLCHLIH